MTFRMDKTSTDAVLPLIRKEFYAFRNGMIADSLRKGGLEQKNIFGLQLPQIKEIAERFRPATADEAASLARSLWSDRGCREARLLACHLMPPASMGRDEAAQWAADAATREEADILAFRLIRHLGCAAETADLLEASENPLHRYTSIAIRRFL